MNNLNGHKIKEVLLEVVNEFSKIGPGYFQTNPILDEAAKRLNIRRKQELEQALLTFWYDLFREGQLAWGHNLDSPDAPFCHLTEKGRITLQNISRDPANPDGYLAHLKKATTLNPIAESYITEALKTYNSNCFKATAVMVGCASESLILELRDELVNKMKSLGKTISRNLIDWKIRTVLKKLNSELESQKRQMDKPLQEAFESYWPAFTQQIRTVRNDAGHPTSIEPVSEQSVNAALLIFPELAILSQSLKSWITSNYS